jgi:uncharacterized protein (DUF111 family)
MSKEQQVNTVRDLILEGRLSAFVDIFNYIDKKYIHQKTGMNYYRLLRNVKSPKGFTFEDCYNIARVLKVPARNIADLIMNQIEASKKK